MRRGEKEDVTDCMDCGLPVDAERERGYRGHGDWALCRACAIRRGARFDEEEDRWLIPPDVTGLGIEDEHRIR